jgi:heme-degrading monooxygenase HmoA
MILERAEFPVKEGQEDAFAQMMQQRGGELLAGADGCHSVRIARGIEDPSKFILLLEWDSVEHHIALTKTAAFDEFKQIAGPFFAGPSNMEHFEIC